MPGTNNGQPITGVRGVILRLDGGLVLEDGRPYPLPARYEQKLRENAEKIGVVSMLNTLGTERSLALLGGAVWWDYLQARQDGEILAKVYQGVIQGLHLPAEQLVAIDTTKEGVSVARKLGCRAIGLAPYKDLRTIAELTDYFETADRVAGQYGSAAIYASQMLDA